LAIGEYKGGYYCRIGSVLNGLEMALNEVFVICYVVDNQDDEKLNYD